MRSAAAAANPGYCTRPPTRERDGRWREDVPLPCENFRICSRMYEILGSKQGVSVRQYENVQI